MADDALLTAAAGGGIEEVRAALDAGADVNRRGAGGESPLLAAVRRGALDIATLLLDRGAEVDRRDDFGNTPLMLAAARGQVEMVRLLLARGARPDVANRWDLGPADWARWAEAGAEIEALLEHAREA